MFGELVKQKRLEKKLSLRAFCRLLGEDASNWSKIERGKLAPSQDEQKLEKIAQILGIQKDSEEWETLTDAVSIDAGKIPDYLLSDKDLMNALPNLFRMIGKRKLTSEELAKLIENIRQENSLGLEGDEEVNLEQVKKFVENGRISEARHLLSMIPPAKSPSLDHWRKVLARPEARLEKSATGGKFKEDVLWLQNHFMEHKGKWVALKHGILLGSHKSRLELHRTLKQSGKLTGAMFFRIGE
jgi:transcriptional regulator with XRE-family HTH domain